MWSLVVLLMPCLCAYSAEEELYTIVNGKIIAKEKYVEEVYGNEVARTYGPYRTVYEEQNYWNKILLQKYAFSEQALRLKEEDPENFVDDGGDIEIITITNDFCGKTIHLESSDGWAKSHQVRIGNRTEEDCYFVMMPVSPSSMVYLFFDCPYGYYGYVTVILSTKEDIAVVFQKKCTVMPMKKNGMKIYDCIPLLVPKPITKESGVEQEYSYDALEVILDKLMYVKDACGKPIKKNMI